MKTKIATSFGLALVLAIGVLGAMLALGSFNSANVQADHGGGNVVAASIKASASPIDPGAVAKWTIVFIAPDDLTPTVDSIVIELEDDVKLPSTINVNDVTITTSDFTNPVTGGATGSVVANPLGVIVDFVGTPKDEPELTLEIGDMEPSNQTPGLQGIKKDATVTVTFRQTAGLTNPTEAKVGTGRYKVKVGTNHTAAKVTNATGNGVLIPRTLESNDAADKRGKVLTVTGKGFQNGTTAYHMAR